MKLEANYTYNGYIDHHSHTSNIIELAPIAIKIVSLRNSPLNFYLYGGAGLTWIVNGEQKSSYYDNKNSIYKVKNQPSYSFIEGEAGILFNIYKSLQLTSGIKYNYLYWATSLPIHKDFGYFGAPMDYYYTSLNLGLRF